MMIRWKKNKNKMNENKKNNIVGILKIKIRWNRNSNRNRKIKKGLE